MFESLLASKEDAINILKSDHDKVKELFEQFKQADSLREKRKIAAEAIMELKIHAEIEEKIFYPAVRAKLNDKDLMNEADEEHHVAKLLIGELDQMDGSEDHWQAKFTVLSENIRHHIREEENEMMSKARGLEIDFEAVGRTLLAAKQQLKKKGVPESAEGKLMTRGVTADSPARTARAKQRLKIVVPGKKKHVAKAAPKKTPAQRKTSHRGGRRKAS